MPTYEYQCEKCGGEFEYFQSMSEPPKQVCEKCGGKLTKLLSAGAGLIFKGSGFYITDYKKQGTSPSVSGSVSHASHSESKSETPSSAPAASTETKSSSGSSD